jgi:hypothetical protein
MHGKRGLSNKKEVIFKIHRMVKKKKAEDEILEGWHG